MSECPTCGRRLRGNVCPYCDEEVLNSGEVEDLGASGEDLVEVFHSRTQAQADFITSLLESEGIPTFQAPGGAAGAGKVAGGRGRGISVQVAEEDVDRARDVIESAKDDLEAADN
ncbi:MAG TPA: DUF2007 domain-containing protein [bacterium]|nr:DUF2007 domain-containing protein [bacterium]